MARAVPGVHFHPGLTPAGHDERAPDDRVALELRKIGTSVVVAHGRTLVEEGDPADDVFKVVEGELRSIRLLPDGRRHVVKFLMPGDYFGMSEGESYSQSVEAVGDSKLVRYPRQRFDALLAGDAAVSRRFYGLVCQELSAAQDRLLLLGRKTALERLVSFVLGIADRQAKTRGASTGDVRLPMNRSDIADYLALTVETVSRLLTHLRSRGFIDLPTPNHIVLLKPQMLESIASGEA
mgnify:CR=1 FL=1